MTVVKVQTQTLVLLDVHAILHRAYHALPDFTTKTGAPTGGLYGLTATLIKLIGDLKPDYFAACYDLPAPTFRKVAYEQYKAGRKPTETNLVSQIERSRELFSALNIPVYEQAGFEADDLIGTIAEQAKKQKNLKIVIASGDLDTLQLVDDDQVLVYTFKKGLNDTIIYNEAAVRTRFNFGPERLPDWKGLRGDPSDNIIGIVGIGEKTATALIVNFGLLEKMYARLKKNPADFQAAGIKDRMIKLLLAGEEEALFSKTLATIRRDVPLDFSLPRGPWRAGLKKEVMEALFDQWEFKTLKNRFNDLFYSQTQRESSPLDISPAPRELQIAAWLLNSERSSPDWLEIRRLTGQIDEPAVRAWLAAALARENLTRIYEEIELPLLPILTAAKTRGILLDLPYLQSLATTIRQELQTLEKKICAAAGREFNLNSPKQLGQVLFDELHLSLKGLRKTAGGGRSTRESELLKLKDTYPIIADILAYRERQKLLSTYLDALPKLADAGGVIHTTFDQTGTATGRFSSRDPNLQNIPGFAGLGKLVRRAFVARPGHRLVALDYSQIEMRVLAVLSGDASLLNFFKNEMDIHTGVAARVFGVAADAVTKEMRRQAKVINFGIIYGMGLNALRASLNTTRAEAADFHRRYFETFPKIRAYFDYLKTAARKLGYTTTYFGRRRYLPLLNSPLPFIRAEAERMALNAPLQGTAADLIKLAMIKADKDLEKNNWRADAHLLLTVHDELIYEIEESKIAAIVPILIQAMEQVVDWPIPLSVKVATGPNWGELA
ncbi:MAG: DNA polymerase [Patescibacteria group bacterium]